MSVVSVRCFKKRHLPRKYNEYIDGYSSFRRNCGATIDKNYIKKAFTKADYVIIAHKPVSEITHLPETRNRSGTNCVAGFAFVHHLGKLPGLHVDLICSNNKTGKLILKRIEDKVVELRLEFINLSAIDEATSFYWKRNYCYVKSTNNPCKLQNKKNTVRKKDGNSYTFDMGKCLITK